MATSCINQYKVNINATIMKNKEAMGVVIRNHEGLQVIDCLASLSPSYHQYVAWRFWPLIQVFPMLITFVFTRFLSI